MKKQKKIKKRHLACITVLVFILTFMIGCGGSGSGGGGGDDPTGSSYWGSMVWDQDNWH